MNATNAILLACVAIALLLRPADAASAGGDAFLGKTAQTNFRVKMAQKPFGMKVQAHSLPLVNAVTPGSAADAAGVKAGFVLTAIGDQHVNAKDWFETMQKAPVGTVLTFDTVDVKAIDDAAFVVPEALDKGFIDFQCSVKSRPFGMDVSVSKDGHATVDAVAAGTPAELAGIKVGDVLVGVAGHAVDAASWPTSFASSWLSFGKSKLPFVLRFRRPAALNVQNPKQMTGRTW